MINWHKDKLLKQQRAQTEQESMRHTKQSAMSATFRLTSRQKSKIRMDDWMMDNSENTKML